MRTIFSTHRLTAAWLLAKKTGGLMFVSAVVRGLGAVAAIVLAAVEGTGPGMDRYLAALVVGAVACALVAAPFPTLVSHQLSTGQGYASATQQCRRWARQVGTSGFGLYVLLSPALAWGATEGASLEASAQMWALLLIMAPCVYLSAQLATEQTLLQIKGLSYLGLWCSGLFGVASLAAVGASLYGGGLYLCAAGIPAGMLLERYAARRALAAREAPACIEGPGLEPARAPAPWPRLLALVGASAGVLLGGFLDQALLGRMGQGAQAAFGLASRVPAFLSVSVFAAGSILMTLLISRRRGYTAGQFNTRVLELVGLMMGLSAVLLGAVWAQGRPLISVLFERGDFGAGDTARVVQALPYAALSYALFPASAVLLRAVAVVARVRVLLLASGAFFGTKVFIGLSTYEVYGLAGVAGSTLMATLVQCAVLGAALTWPPRPAIER